MNKERLQLYIDYEAELETYIDRAFKIEETHYQFMKRIIGFENNCEWIDIKHKNKIIGFLIIGTGEYTHPDTDYFIAQADIDPTYRHKGYMTKAVKDYVDNHKGIYCMLIINTNTSAKAFWLKRYKELGYKQIPLRKLKGVVDERVCQQYGFAPNS